MTAHALHTSPAVSTSGLLISLAQTLPDNARALRREAERLADRLQASHTLALDRRASDLLAQLLILTDCAELAQYPDDALIDAEFDA